jgi:hypothetical protein
VESFVGYVLNISDFKGLGLYFKAWRLSYRKLYISQGVLSLISYEYYIGQKTVDIPVKEAYYFP